MPAINRDARKPLRAEMQVGSQSRVTKSDRFHVRGDHVPFIIATEGKDKTRHVCMVSVGGTEIASEATASRDQPTSFAWTSA